MPAEKNTALRILVPLIVLALCAGFVSVIIFGKSMTTAPSAAPASPAVGTATAQSPAEEPSTAALQQSDTPNSTGDAVGADIPNQVPAAIEPVATAVDEQAVPDDAAATSTDAAPAVADGPNPYHARAYDAGAIPASIGALDSATGYRAHITFTPFGAGVESITMTDFFETIEKKNHYPLQHVRLGQTVSGDPVTLASLAARGINIDGHFVDLFADSETSRAVWRETAPGSFVCEILDDAGDTVVRITRIFTVTPGSYEISVRQSLENLSASDLTITWIQYGPIDLPREKSGYRLDLRRARFGYLLDPTRDPSRQFVQADSNLRRRSDIIKKATTKGDDQLWPRHASYKFADELVWLAQTSRYFAFIVHPLVDSQQAASNIANPSTNPIAKPLALAGEVYAVAWPDQSNPGEHDLLLQMTSKPMEVGAGSALDLSFAAYAGPLGRRQLSPKQDPVFGALGLSKIVIYNIGGPCAFCTFQPLARGLLAFLTILHDSVVFDWGLAIIILVFCVRGVLHPITRRSQIGILRFSKQMQALAPKQQKLRERYKDDPKQLNKEMMRLMREEGVSYTGMLGCLPMFLQSPVWIALYAMLYFSFDLRHEAAFFGLFQTVSGGHWHFLADLSSADHFISFGGKAIATLPLFGSITGINVLPFLLGIVFFLQQKYLTPPPSATQTPEQQTQQKIMKVMMVIMFPVMIYNAPSGLSLYFITNSTLGIVESRYIRSHADKMELESPKRSATARKKVKSTSKSATNPFRKDRDELRRQFKKRK